MKAMIIDDEVQRAPVKIIRELLQTEGVLVEANCEFLGKLGADDFCARVRGLDRPPDLAVIDYSLHWKDLEGGEWNGDRVARFLRQHWASDVPFYILFVSSYLKSMATPYEQLVDLLKVPFAGFVELSPGWEEDVRQHVRWACDLVRAEKGRSIAALSGAGGNVEAFFGEAIVGRAPSLIQVGHVASRASRTDAAVLIAGESGTGKELMAKAIHNASLRAGAPFVAVNCGAIPENLLESELFGHKKGAFTGALTDKPGIFESANSGTLFLDEIGEMPLNMQVKLLRVLQDREIVRVGEVKPRPVNIRIVAATNRVLEDEIKAGRFREDLYYRLNVIKVAMPPLRERAADVVDLADYFLHSAAAEYTVAVRGFSPSAQRALKSYAWPGNVRELENAVKRAVLLCDAEMVEVDHLPENVRGGKATLRGDAWKETEEEFKRSYFSRILEECQGNITRAAEKAEVSREHFSKTLKQLGINVTGR